MKKIAIPANNRMTWDKEECCWVKQLPGCQEGYMVGTPKDLTFAVTIPPDHELLKDEFYNWDRIKEAFILWTPNNRTCGPDMTR